MNKLSQIPSLGKFTGSALARHSPNRQLSPSFLAGDEEGRQHNPAQAPDTVIAAACSAASIFVFIIAVCGFIAPAVGEILLSVRN